MDTVLLFVAIGLLVYIIYQQNKKERPAEPKSGTNYREHLPELLGKTCEITVKKPLLSIDIAFSITGTVIDFDDEWIVIRKEGKKQNMMKIFRIDNINGIKELSEMKS